MNIFIDHQYLTIYNGEFKKYVEEAIIEPLQQTYVVTVSKSFDETRNLLSLNTYDIVILTGYSSEILAMITVDKETKIVPIIYDMTAEYILAEISENAYLSEIVMHKSRLIFISHKIICLNETIADQIIKLYSGYKSHGVDVASKISIVDYNYNIDNSEIKNKIIKGKYVLIKESVNGLTFVSQDFENVFLDLLDNEFPDVKIIIISDNFPQNLLYQIKVKHLDNKIQVYENVSYENLRSLYKYSLFTMFVSRFDNDIYNLCDAISSDALCLINESNLVICNFIGDCGNYYSNDNLNMNEIISIVLKTSKDAIDLLKKEQKDRLNENLKLNKRTINKILSSLF